MAGTADNNHKTPQRIGVAVVVDGSEVLVGIREAGSDLAGLAEFPGGKCQDGEPPSTCAERECLEETALEVSADELLYQTTHTYPHGTVDISFYLCSLRGPRDAIPPSGSFRWVPRLELGGLSFPAANRPVIAAISADEASLRRDLPIRPSRPD